MKITRKQLRKLINEVTNYASLPHQGMPTLRKVIRQVIQPQDVYQVIDQLRDPVYQIPLNRINANLVIHELMLPVRSYHRQIMAILKNNYPSVYNQMVGQEHEPFGPGQFPVVHNKKPQEIDMKRLIAEIQKIYDDEFVRSYIQGLHDPYTNASLE